MVQNIMNLKTFYKKLSNSSKNGFDGTVFVLELSNTDKKENIERIESLSDGDELRLDFVRQGEKIIANVYNMNDEEIGSLASYADYIWELGRSGELEIDRIEACGVVPISKRKKGSKKAIVNAKFYLSESCYMKQISLYEDDFDSSTDVEDLFDTFDSNTDVEELFGENDDIDVKKISDAVSEMVMVESTVTEDEDTTDEDVDAFAKEAYEKKIGEFISLNSSDVVLGGGEPHEDIAEDVDATLSEEGAESVEIASSEDDAEIASNEDDAESAETLSGEEDTDSKTHAGDNSAIYNYVAPNYSHTEEDLIDSREDRKQKYFYTQRFETIDSIKGEIKHIMDEAVWDTREALKMRTINSQIMLDAMFNSMTILRARRITDYLFLNFIFDNVVTQYELLSEALDKIHAGCEAMAKEMAKHERNNELFIKGRKDINGYVGSNDQFLLKFAENLDKMWNAIPKNDKLQTIIEKTFNVMTLIKDISQKKIVLKDISGEVAENMQYVSSTIILEYYEKWSSVYEYLPFIKAKKKAFYENELLNVNNEIEEIKKHYDEIKTEKNDRIKAVRDELRECEDHLSSMSIFSFSSKKNYRERIEELIKEEEQLKKDIDTINAEYNVKISDPVVRAEAIKSKINWYSAD